MAGQCALLVCMTNRKMFCSEFGLRVGLVDFVQKYYLDIDCEISFSLLHGAYIIINLSYPSCESYLEWLYYWLDLDPL